MSHPRAWNLRLNLDEFNALAVSLYADADRALALQGMTLGANGGSLPEGVPDALRRGWNLGARMYQEALEYQALQAERGRASAEKRRQSTGSAQPQRSEPPFEPALEPPFDDSSNLTTIDNRQSPELQSPISEQRGRVRDGSSAGSGRITASEWEPLREHRDLCAVRNADCELQLARFRERNIGQTDTDQGWGVRFMQWLGRSKPERSVSPEQVASPTLDEWLDFARGQARGIGPDGETWPKELATARWHENQAKGWRFVADWRADCTSAAQKWAGYEKTNAQRNSRRMR